MERNLLPIDRSGSQRLEKPALRIPEYQSPGPGNTVRERSTLSLEHPRTERHSAQGGFTLIEVLVSAVIISVALLGLAALQTTSVRFNQSALVRTHAVNLSYDIADRMRANSENAEDYDSDNTPPAGSLAENDLTDWNARVADLAPSGASPAPAGSIGVTSDNEIEITIQWGDRDENNTSFRMTTRL